MRKVIARNDPCPCGSDKKYKKCCQQSDQEQRVTDHKLRRLESQVMQHHLLP